MACKGMLQPPAWLALSDCCPSQGLGPADHIQYGRISCLTGQVTGKPDPALAYKGRSGSQRTRWPALPKRAPSINKFRDVGCLILTTAMMRMFETRAQYMIDLDALGRDVGCPMDDSLMFSR